MISDFEWASFKIIHLFYVMGGIMGIYWYLVNFDKKEYVSLGMKFGDWLLSDDTKAIFWLIAEDAYPMVLTREEYKQFIENIDKAEEIIDNAKREFKYLGRWARDKIAVIPDYEEYLEEIKDFKDITLDVVNELVKLFTRWYEEISKAKQEEVFLKEESLREINEALENFKKWQKILTKESTNL